MALSALLALGLAEEAKVVLPYAGYPYAYNGYPYAQQSYGYTGHPYGSGGQSYGYAGLSYGYARQPNGYAGQSYGYTSNPYGNTGHPYGYAAAPIEYVAPVPSSQFHVQDQFGNLNYGYSNLNSAKQEAGNTYGGVSGAYSYVDATGVLQLVRYVADDAGFRVVDSRLPVAPVFDAVGPVAPTDTIEVIEAKAAFAKAYAAQETAVAEAAFVTI